MNNNLQKEMFLMTLIHDLKNPLLAQISALSQLSNGIYGELKESQKEIIEMTLNSCNYMQKLLFNLLETYKYENGHIKLEKKYFNPENFVKTCITEQYSLIKEKQLDIIFKSTLREEENIIYADELQLRRVVENILSNQIFYAFKNTKIRINLFKKTNKIIFSFENSSPEIESDAKSEIFEKFKTTNISKQNFSAGLGLYLSKQIIEAHSGKIYLDAQKNINKFIFNIPQNNKEKTQVVW